MQHLYKSKAAQSQDSLCQERSGSIEHRVKTLHASRASM